MQALGKIKQKLKRISLQEYQREFEIYFLVLLNVVLHSWWTIHEYTQNINQF